MSIVRLDGVSKVFQSGETSLTVLDGIHFELAEGEIVAISGASGSGKSTLLNLMGGLDRPTAGEIHVHIDVIVHKHPTGVDQKAMSLDLLERGDAYDAQ